MSPLAHIETKLLTTLPALNMKPTLERAAEVGDLLHEARKLIEHGAWIPWVKRVGLSRRTAHDYMAVATHLGNVRPVAASMGLRAFLEYVRSARAAERQREREQLRAELAASQGGVPGVSLKNVDARTFGWPDGLDCVVADPPWSEMDLYRWTAGLAASNLRPGGLLLVQCGQSDLDKVFAILGGAGLVYIWTLGIWYTQVSQAVPIRRFRSTWRPLLLYSNGPADLPDDMMTDGYTVKTEPQNYHKWQQPLAPFRFWLGRLLKPGSTVADPFVGSGTVGAACIELGLRYIGTEIDRTTFRIARGRLAGVADTKPAVKSSRV